MEGGLRLGLLLLAAGLLIGHALYFNFLNDDAFISFRYADNLVRHGELVFNPGERVEGYTNFLWTIAMAGVLALGLDIAFWSKALSILCAVGTLVAVTQFTSRLIGRSSPWDTVSAFLLAAAPAYACWSTGGLETQLFTFCMTMGWTCYLDANLHRERPLYQCSIWFALAAMTRPEGMLVFGLLGIYHVIGMLAVERRWQPRRDEYMCAAIFLLIFVPYFAWRWQYYGYPFPNTYYVKTGATNFWAPGGRYVLSWVNDHLIWLLPFLLYGAVKFLQKSHRTVLYLALFLTTIYTLHVARVGGDFMGLHRFLVPVMPLLALIAALGIRYFIQLAVERPAAKWPIVALGLTLCLYGGYHVTKVDQKAMTIGSDAGVDRIGWLKMFHGQCEAIGRWLAKNAEPDASIAITAAGIIPYYSRLYTVDVLGLNDEWVAHNVKAHGNRPGHTKSAPLSYVLQKEVDYLVYHPTIANTAPRRSARDRKSWARRGYHWRAVEVPGLSPPWWGFWERTKGGSRASEQTP